MDQASADNKRRRWSHNETLGFLRCYLTHRREFSRHKRKRLGYAHVLEDMISKGITDSERTPLCLESKMRSLLCSYNTARNKSNRADDIKPSFAPYMELMDQIFEHTAEQWPTVKKSQLSSSMDMDSDTTDNCSESDRRSLRHINKVEPDYNTGNSTGPCLSPYMEVMDNTFQSNAEISNNYSLHLGQLPERTQVKEENVSSPQSPSSLPTDPVSSPAPLVSVKSASTSATRLSNITLPPPPPIPTARKKRSSREQYYEKKMRLKKIEMKEKAKQREEAFKRIEDMLRQKWEKDMALEQRKLSLLEKLANSRN